MSTDIGIHSFEAYKQAYQYSLDNPESFWSEIAREQFHWYKNWDKVEILCIQMVQRMHFIAIIPFSVKGIIYRANLEHNVRVTLNIYKLNLPNVYKTYFKNLPLL